MVLSQDGMGEAGQQGVEISVIVIAYTRRKFIEPCLLSVLNQDFDRDRFEIILVKNFIDPQFDAEFSKKGVIIINSTERGGIYRKVYEGGVQRARGGEVICFLEDDDEFLPEKLKLVHQEFLDAELCYLHNNLVPVDENGNRVAFTEITRAFNNSSISVRKKCINWELFRQIDIATSMDILLYLSALDSGGRIREIDKPLTLYRVHAMSDSNSKIYADFDSYCRNEIGKNRESVALYEKVLPSFRDRRVREAIVSRIQGAKFKLRLYGEPVDVGLPEMFYTILVPIDPLGGESLRLRLFRIKYSLASMMPKPVRQFAVRKMYRDLQKLVRIKST
ncbi:glycosyltransferase [Thermogymnomonas acidicola]|uniref:glycosyltransferase n=1 Tax=Thermogymnomonas acidicola TaxID=399579 RepID=UPI00149441E4|nr:glycosyltransferase [Thermogymnomonas acidicola]